MTASEKRNFTYRFPAINSKRGLAPPDPLLTFVFRVTIVWSVAVPVVRIESRHRGIQQ